MKWLAALLLPLALLAVVVACEGEGEEAATGTPSVETTATVTPQETPSPEASPTPEGTPAPGEIPRQGTTLGSEDAPLTIVEYSEFLCPFCARAALETIPQLEEKYIATGKVKLVFKHYVVHGEQAVLAAGASECASDQNAFWEYHDILFSRQGSVEFSIENLKQFAVELGLDTDSFDTCMDTEAYLDNVAANVQEANRRGVNATPTFYVGQIQIVGAKSVGEFEAAIEDELARLGEATEPE
jgi:protein-disulfide isomerase